jgi:hypothetical protein
MEPITAIGIVIFVEENRHSGAADIAGIVSISSAILDKFGYSRCLISSTKKPKILGINGEWAYHSPTGLVEEYR